VASPHADSAVADAGGGVYSIVPQTTAATMADLIRRFTFDLSPRTGKNIVYAIARSAGVIPEPVLMGDHVQPRLQVGLEWVVDGLDGLDELLGAAGTQNR